MLIAASYGFAPFGIMPEVAGPAGSYLRILNWGTLPLLLYGATRRYLQGVGQVRAVTVTFVLANLLNWFANWVLIYGKFGMPAMGVDGSAASTCIARYAMAAALLGFALAATSGGCGHPLYSALGSAASGAAAAPGPIGVRRRQGRSCWNVGAWNLATLSAAG